MLLVLVASLVCFWAISHPPLAVMKEPIPVSINSTGPGIRISLGSVPSKDIQDHPLAVEKMVPSEVITHITLALTLSNNMRSRLLVP